MRFLFPYLLRYARQHGHQIMLDFAKDAALDQLSENMFGRPAPMTGQPTVGSVFYAFFKTAIKQAERDMGRPRVTQALLAQGISHGGVQELCRGQDPTNLSDVMIISRECMEMLNKTSGMIAAEQKPPTKSGLFTSILSPDMRVGLAASGSSEIE